jgi:hypothetical protein
LTVPYGFGIVGTTDAADPATAFFGFFPPSMPWLLLLPLLFFLPLGPGPSPGALRRVGGPLLKKWSNRW